MFVVSVSKNKIKKIVIGIFVVLAVALLVFYVVNKLQNRQVTEVDAAFSTVASDSEDRLRFISNFGWEVDKDPIEVREVVIPEEFDDVYKNYNEIQLSQGFDLTNYAGRRVKRWTYVIRNYPETSPEDDFIRINILVYDGNVIGGDVCSIKLDGFMHGFNKE